MKYRYNYKLIGFIDYWIMINQLVKRAKRFGVRLISYLNFLYHEAKYSKSLLVDKSLELLYVFVSVPFPNISRTRLFPSFCVVLKTGELNGYPCIIYYVLICARSEQGNAAFVSNNHQKTSLLKYKLLMIKSIVDYLRCKNPILYRFMSLQMCVEWLKYIKSQNTQDMKRWNCIDGIPCTTLYWKSSISVIIILIRS